MINFMDFLQELRVYFLHLENYGTYDKNDERLESEKEKRNLFENVQFFERMEDINNEDARLFKDILAYDISGCSVKDILKIFETEKALEATNKLLKDEK